jgi:hypothetical protein
MTDTVRCMLDAPVYDIETWPVHDGEVGDDDRAADVERMRLLDDMVAGTHEDEREEREKDRAAHDGHDTELPRGASKKSRWMAGSSTNVEC